MYVYSIAFSLRRFCIKTCYPKSTSLKYNSSSLCFLTRGPKCCFSFYCTELIKVEKEVFPSSSCHVVSQKSSNNGESYATSKGKPFGGVQGIALFKIQ